MKKKYRDWMANLPERTLNTSLNQILIPGTHNSGSFDCSWQNPPGLDADSTILNVLKIPFASKIVERWAKCQRHTIKIQLEDGIRYLDVRLSTNNGLIYLCHGLCSISWTQFVEDLGSFLDENPQELVIVDVKKRYGFNEKDDFTVVDMLYQRIGQNRFANTNLSPSSSLNDFRNAGVQCICVYPDYTGLHQNIWNRQCLQSPWPNSSNLTDVINFVHDRVATRDSQQFHVSQYILTLGTKEILSRLFPLGNPTSIMEMGESLTTLVPNLVTDLHKKLNFNILIVDDYDINENRFVATILEINNT
jgi:hypothetical protein